MSTSQRVLVTGINGYVGSFVTYEFLKEGYKVRGTVRSVKDTEKYYFVDNFPNKENLEIVELDLSNKEEIDNAVKGCDFIAHVASPVSFDKNLTWNFFFKSSVEGCMNILFAAQKYQVKKVVITGSIACMIYNNRKKPTLINGLPIKIFSEEDWSDPYQKNIPLYGKGKTLSEQQAWNYYHTLDPNNRFKLTFINPGLVIGPVFNKDSISSLQYFSFLNGANEPSGYPDLCHALIDVRDVAKCHRLAIESNEVDGKRLICVNETLSMQEVSDILRKFYPNIGIPNKMMSHSKLFIYNYFKKGLEFYLIAWGRKMIFRNNLIKNTLKIENFIDIQKTLKDMMEKLIENKKFGFGNN